MTNVGSARRLLRVGDLARPELEHLLDLATAIKTAPASFADRFRHETLVCIFERPSTRTRLAFAAAAHRLGMLPLTVSPGDLQLSRGEPIADTARSVSAYAAAVVVRAASHETVADLAEFATVPVVNALSDEHHPCEAIAALLTTRERFGRLSGIKLAYLGDGNNVATSLLEAAAIAGMRATFACPAGYEPPAEVVAAAETRAAGEGGSAEVVNDPADAVIDAQVVYTDVWSPRGRRAAFAPYRVTAELMRRADPDAVFLHCLPARRGEEVDADVIDGPRSLVWQQVANHLPTAQAVICWCLDRDRR
jgi:ornithine carbamoyltransferase